MMLRNIINTTIGFKTRKLRLSVAGLIQAILLPRGVIAVIPAYNRQR
ncbi:MAG: hypothetical protein JST63_02830 [Bacteroidetes bacterium]|nr:hypothetical protein [Bacteroidota bacterium]